MSRIQTALVWTTLVLVAVVGFLHTGPIARIVRPESHLESLRLARAEELAEVRVEAEFYAARSTMLRGKTLKPDVFPPPNATGAPAVGSYEAAFDIAKAREIRDREKALFLEYELTRLDEALADSREKRSGR